ncbi:hypothetical protein G6F42_015483 [Rhizopus arrhizus]|nr:hypothetical protein G6F42_015483 [Rhizopus arrhizus]
MASSRSRFRKSDLLSNLSLSTTATLSSSISTASIRSFMSQTMSQISNASTTFRIGHNRRIMPHGSTRQIMHKSATEKMISTKKTAKSMDNEPLVHYNGPYQTLESLPAEKLNWIKDEQTSTLVKNPLTNYTKSIVLRKPLTRSQTYPALTSNAYSRPLQTKPKGMFYLRVLQVIATDTSKMKKLASIAPLRNLTRHFYCKYTLYTALYDTLTLQNSDVDDQTTATISIYAQNKSSNLFQSRHQKQEICLGKESIHIALHPKSKTTERFVLNSNPSAGQSNDIQLLVVHGTFVSRRTQNMLNNTILFEDFITAYVHTGMVPRWDRFWGILRGVQFELYDFEYKENRPPLYVIPLDHFISAFDPSEEDGEEIRIDIGARGIALQFTENAISKSKRDWVVDDLECRMYLLPESSAAAREWESKFNYVASIFDEVRGWDTNSSNDSYHENNSDTDTYSYDDDDDDEDDEANSVPLKLLW